MKILVAVFVAALFCTVVGCNPDSTVNTDDRSVTTPGTTPDRTPDRATRGGANDLPAGVEETTADELPSAGTDNE